MSVTEKKKSSPSTGSGRTESVVPTAVMEVGDLKAALGSVIAAVERRNTIPILSNVLLAFSAVGTGAMAATATNLDMQVTRTVPAKVSGASWGATVCAHTLKAMADKLPAGAEVTLTLDDGRLVVRSGRARFALPVLPVEDFPELGGVNGADGSAFGQFEIEGAVWMAMVNHVEHAISTEETRYYLNGIFLERAEAEMLMVATDGHRLAVAKRTAPDGSEVLNEVGGVIIPRACLGVVKALCAEARIDVALNRRMLRIDAGEVVMTTKLVDGEFPPWRRVVPESNDKCIGFEPKALAEAVGRVVVVASDKTRAVKLAAAADCLTLTVVSPENGTASEEMGCSYAGPPFEVGCNATYLLAVLARLTGDGAEVLVHDAAAPMLWRESDHARDRQVLMPMRV